MEHKDQLTVRKGRRKTQLLRVLILLLFPELNRQFVGKTTGSYHSTWSLSCPMRSLWFDYHVAPVAGEFGALWRGWSWWQRTQAFWKVSNGQGCLDYDGMFWEVERLVPVRTEKKLIHVHGAADENSPAHLSIVVRLFKAPVNSADQVIRIDRHYLRLRCEQNVRLRFCLVPSSSSPITGGSGVDNEVSNYLTFNQFYLNTLSIRVSTHWMNK